MNYIGISENRLHHILGVARKAYQIAKDMGYAESFCRRCFILGWTHDVGYEFSESSSEHSRLSAEMLRTLVGTEEDDIFERCCEAIKNHGHYTSECSTEYLILNMADMQVDSEGHDVSVIERLEDIRKRYGEHSDEYLTACDVCYRIGLTVVNLASHIT